MTRAATAAAPKSQKSQKTYILTLLNKFGRDPGFPQARAHSGGHIACTRRFYRRVVRDWENQRAAAKTTTNHVPAAKTGTRRPRHVPVNILAIPAAKPSASLAETVEIARDLIQRAGGKAEAAKLIGVL